MSAIFKFLIKINTFQRFTRPGASESYFRRTYADKHKTPGSKTTSKQLIIHGTDNSAKLRVRRAHPFDALRVQRFVREHSAATWPGLVTSTDPPGTQLVMTDFVARILAQGHSMLVEQHEPRRGWNHLRGLALSSVVCPWDAVLMERWARCLRCTKSRRLVTFSAHCLQAPGLHDKYRVHKIMQTMLVVPPNSDDTEVTSILVKNIIQRGRDVGFPILRFDVTTDPLVKALEDKLNLKKEWQFFYDIVPKTNMQEITLPTKDVTVPSQIKGKEDTKSDDTTIKGNFVAVYTMDMTAGSPSSKKIRIT